MSLKSIRKANGLSQEELAKSANVSVSMIQSLENGRRTGSVETIVKLAQALNVTTDELIYARNTTNSTKYVQAADE